MYLGWLCCFIHQRNILYNPVMESWVSFIRGIDFDRSFVHHTFLKLGKFWTVSLKNAFPLLYWNFFQSTCHANIWTILLKRCIFFWWLHMFKATIILKHLKFKGRTALQLNFHLLDGDSRKQNVCFLVCWQPGPTCQGSTHN